MDQNSFKAGQLSLTQNARVERRLELPAGEQWCICLACARPRAQSTGQRESEDTGPHNQVYILFFKVKNILLFVVSSISFVSNKMIMSVVFKGLKHKQLKKNAHTRHCSTSLLPQHCGGRNRKKGIPQWVPGLLGLKTKAPFQPSSPKFKKKIKFVQQINEYNTLFYRDNVTYWLRYSSRATRWQKRWLIHFTEESG